MPPAIDSAAPEPAIPVRQVPLGRPIEWLKLGIRDFCKAPMPSLFHGALVASGGLVILAIAAFYWKLLPGAFTGFVLMGPIIATGLYELSRRIEIGHYPTINHVIGAWKRGTRPLVQLGLLLFLAGTAWVAVSAILFALFVKAPIEGPEGFLRYVFVAQGSQLFVLWAVLGGIGAALVFAATAVSAPLLLDRRVGLRTAILTSVHAVGDNPLPMALWALVIMLATAVSMATLMFGFIFAIPIIGHATWHAYRDLVDAEGLPPRQ